MYCNGLCVRSARRLRRASFLHRSVNPKLTSWKICHGCRVCLHCKRETSVTQWERRQASCDRNKTRSKTEFEDSKTDLGPLLEWRRGKGGEAGGFEREGEGVAILVREHGKNRNEEVERK